MEEWKECKLSDICDYGKDRIEVSSLDNSNYISTENMLPNRAGITTATTLPTGEYTPSFEIDDTLVSNIRPYFKKIWKATFSGGCSADVLVFKAKENVSKEYLYYVLADDEFFRYSMTTSKGTKMPRGDKTSIMNYPIKLPPLPTQQKIAAILSSLDDKIELNNKINTNLEQQAQALFKNWFVDFDPFGGKMPEGWKVGKLSEIAEITSGKRPPMKQSDYSKDVSISLVGAASVMGYTNQVLYNEPILITGRVGTHGVIQRFSTECWPSDNTLVVKSQYYEYVYQIMCNIDYDNMNRGSTQPLITQSDLGKVECIIPDEGNLNKFEQLTNNLFAKVQENQLENQKLANIRDTLLPKLMNGEIFIQEAYSNEDIFV